MMLRDLLRLHGPEGTETDMKHYRNNGYAHGADLIKQLIGKMQSCSRGCRRALLTGIYSLISFRIVKSLPDIRRKRHESYLVQKNICVLIDRAVIFKADYTQKLSSAS